MNLDRDISQRIELMRFPLIVGVVFIHAFPVLISAGGQYGTTNPGELNTFIRTLISDVFARISVPMLFAMGGFLFFQGLGESEQKLLPMQFFLKKWKSRIRSLVIPFLFWNFAVMMFMLLIQHSPWQYFFAEVASISEFSVFDALNALLGITHAPIAYQFWFIRNLIVLTMLSPLIYLALRKIPHTWLAAIGFAWLFKVWNIRIPDGPGLFFFSLGAFLALYPVNLKRWDSKAWYLLLFYLTVAVIDALNKHSWFTGYLHNFSYLTGVVALFVFTSKLQNREWIKTKLIKIAPAGFFVFAMHEPFLTLLRKTTYVLFRPSGDFAIVLLYFVNPVLVIIICTLFYRLMNSKIPRLTQIVTGGR